MIHVLDPGNKIGHNARAAGNILKGTVVYRSGMDANGNYLYKNPLTGTAAAVSVFFCDKFRYLDDLSDTASAVELISSGDSIVVYQGGLFQTNKFLGFGTSTSQQYLWDGKQLDSASQAYWTITHTAIGGTIGATRPIYAWPSTAAATPGYLRLSTATQNNSTFERFNKIWKPEALLGNAGYSGDVRLQVRNIASVQKDGAQYFSGVSTVANFIS